MSTNRPRLPANQQLIQGDRWPVVGEKSPAASQQAWEIRIDGSVMRPWVLSLSELRGLDPREFTTDIHCVTRWSKFDMRFEGVALARVLDWVEPLPSARYLSVTARSERRHSSSLTLSEALALGTFLAWSANGQPLPEIHGGPVRLVVPGRYFYKSVKWVEQIELLEKDRLGYWEREAGYHNHADPWREERYMAPSLSRQEAARLIASRDFSGRDLRGIQASERDLTGLQARQAQLRDADFRGSILTHADFTGANLSNAHLDHATLQGACLRDADVEGASFVGADLRGADLRVAALFGASFCAVDEAGRVSDCASIDATTQIAVDKLAALTDSQRAWFEENI